jgi:hypothetical protein
LRHDGDGLGMIGQDEPCVMAGIDMVKQILR